MRRAKIITTLGPASCDESVISNLIDAGANVVRLNFSHGTHDYHRMLFQRVRKISKRKGQPIAIMQDLQGPKIRVGHLPGNGEVTLIEGQEVGLVYRASVTREMWQDQGLIPHSYRGLFQDASKGDPVLLDDGRLSLRVIGKRRGVVRCEVMRGGELGQRKGINLPGMRLSLPAISEKDRSDLLFGKKLGVDLIALSFVRCANDVLEAKALAKRIPIIAKIEKPEGVANMDSILHASDGIMVARGDLGVEMPAEQVPLVQKQLVEETNRRGKLVIIATEMLDSMRISPRPTRAEVSDVANAILDGADAVMLSGETASGQFPVESVMAMDRIITETESSVRYWKQTDRPVIKERESVNALARAAVVAAREIGAKQIICLSGSGYTAGLLSDYRPKARIIAGTDRPDAYRRMALDWGVNPILISKVPTTVEGLINELTASALKRGYVKRGEQAILVFGSRRGGPSEILKIHML